ncbi:MAG: RCC1 repeat-containing protein, partial [Nitrospirae bacterium]|nr:RCC1 repeat-containing protein [Nitrospirota bacterium]
KPDGTVWAWGYNYSGQLGNGTYDSNPHPTPVQVNGLAGIVEISSNIALKSDGTVWVWGSNSNGQLGNGTYDSNPHPTPIQVSGLSGVVAIAGGGSHNLALKSDGTVWSWGYNRYGQLGYTTTSMSNPTPTQVSGISGVIAIAAYSPNSIVLMSDGTVYTWGSNLSGQLGNTTNAGNQNANPTPTQVSGISGVIAISAGYLSSYVLKSDGSVWAWGYNGYGKLGNSTNQNNGNPNPTPTQVIGISDVTAIAGGGYHAMALKSDGTVWTWGSNQFGEMGNNTNYMTGNANPTPTQVIGISGVTAIAASSYSVVLKSDGTVWAWGRNFSGELGNTTNIGSNLGGNFIPTQVSGLNLN